MPPRKGRGRGRGGAKGPSSSNGARGGAKQLLAKEEPNALPSLMLKLRIDFSRLPWSTPGKPVEKSHPITPPPSNPESPSPEMAPGPQEEMEDNLKDTVQTLYNIQSNTHGYLGPETQRALVLNFKILSSNLQGVERSAQHVDKKLPPEVLEYVDEGRNPDIYTREFVEIVQKGNRYLKGKSQAFANFRDTLAKQMVEQWPEMKEAVDRVLESKGTGVQDLQGMNGVNTTSAGPSNQATGGQ